MFDSVVTSKDIRQRETIKAAKQKSLASHTTDKNFIFSLYKKLLPVDKKKQENISLFTKEDEKNI